jgi:transposase
MTKINAAYKFKLIPTFEQAAIFSQWVGTCRFLDNLALEQRITVWEDRGISLNSDATNQ